MLQEGDKCNIINELIVKCPYILNLWSLDIHSYNPIHHFSGYYYATVSKHSQNIFLIYYVLISFTKSTYPKSKRFILNMEPVNVLLHFFHICFNRIKISEWVAWKEIKCYKVYICWWKKIIVWGQKSLCVHTSRLIRNMHFMFKTNLKFIKWNFPLLATELTA